MIVNVGLPRLSSDRKVAPLVRKKGTAINDGTPKVRNTFGLPAVVACPEHTEWCAAVCYALKLQIFPGVRNLVEANWDVVSPHLNDADTLHWMLSELVAECRIEYVRAKIPEGEWVFRHFWDGDIPSVAFAKAIKRVAEDFPEFQFWLYTRSFKVVPLLMGASNLAVYLSVDKDNVLDAVRVEKALLSEPMLAFCADTWEETEGLAAKFPHRRKGPACPELTGKIPMVVWDDDGVFGHGACIECGMCIYGRNNVRFAATNRKGG